MADATIMVRLAYGDDGLDVRLPAERTALVQPRYRPGVADPGATLTEALRRPVAGPPLREMVRKGQTVAISACDITRPQPRQLMIPAVLAELAAVVRPDDITILVATGTHRANTDAELRAMFGDEVAGSVRILNHDARNDADLVWCGRHGEDVPVWLNRAWVDADVRLTTGFVEPHFFAGFSGGPKLVAPGLAGLQTVLTLHDAVRIGDPRATWGIIEGNPVHDDVRAIAAATGVDFAFDVILNRDQEIVGAYAGELFAMHRAACAAAKDNAMAPVDAAFDVVLTTNSGFPLDQNLYQAVKGMSAAAEVVRPGGVIVCAAECRDGFPDHGSYREVLTSAPSPESLLERIAARSHTVPDQWQVQVQARIQAKARVVVHSAYLSADDLRAAHLDHTADVEKTVAEALHAAGDSARVCVLPEGPQTIPYLAG
ncbi:MAG: nickel-dependent lactate racemase [Actinopolymorphaceae bacterium]